MSPNWLNTAIDVFNRVNTYTSDTADSKGQNYVTLDKFDSVEYDSSHLWECQIDGAPAPFNKWFPAQSVDEPSKGVTVSAISFGLEEVNVLNGYNAVNLRTELIDDDKATLEQWLRLWQKSTAATDSRGFAYAGFRYLEEILHKMYITKYTWQKEKVYTREYLILPTGDINTAKTNEPAIKVLNVNFAVFGMREI